MVNNISISATSLEEMLLLRVLVLQTLRSVFYKNEEIYRCVHCYARKDQMLQRLFDTKVVIIAHASTHCISTGKKEQEQDEQFIPCYQELQPTEDHL